MNNKKIAIILPSYKEEEALPILLEELSQYLNSNHIVIIADDSPPELRAKLVKNCQVAFTSKIAKLDFSFSSLKSGRGCAVLRGFNYVLDNYGEYDFFIECDSDGSHTANDINQLMISDRNIDLMIGSRYHNESMIIGWSISRSVFSKVLNSVIPRILNLPCTDITNGLRRYSRRTITIFNLKKPINKGFIYLTEQALLVKNAGYTISEIPTIFINRKIGKSTVGIKEIYFSIYGLFMLILKRKI